VHVEAGGSIGDDPDVAPAQEMVQRIARDAPDEMQARRRAVAGGELAHGLHARAGTDHDQVVLRRQVRERRDEAVDAPHQVDVALIHEQARALGNVEGEPDCLRRRWSRRVLQHRDVADRERRLAQAVVLRHQRGPLLVGGDHQVRAPDRPALEPVPDQRDRERPVGRGIGDQQLMRVVDQAGAGEACRQPAGERGEEVVRMDEVGLLLPCVAPEREPELEVRQPLRAQRRPLDAHRAKRRRGEGPVRL
jgi:hypothetical protein